MKPIALAFASALVASLLATAASSAELPASHGYVNDFAGVIGESTEVDLAARLREFEAQTRVEIVVATVTSLDERKIEEYAATLFRQWEVGQKGVEAGHGILVFVFPAGRWTRIEVGLGLQPVLPEALAADIIRTHVEPRFSSEDFAGGIVNGVDRLIELVRANHVLTAEEVSRLNGTYRPPEDWLPFVPLFGVFLGLAGMAIGVGLRAQHIGMIIVGLLVGGTLSFFALDTIPQLARFVLAPIAATGAITGFILGGRRGWRRWVRGPGTRSRGWIFDTPGGDDGSPGGWGSD